MLRGPNGQVRYRHGQPADRELYTLGGPETWLPHATRVKRAAAAAGQGQKCPGRSALVAGVMNENCDTANE